MEGGGWTHRDRGYRGCSFCGGSGVTPTVGEVVAGFHPLRNHGGHTPSPQIHYRGLSREILKGGDRVLMEAIRSAGCGVELLPVVHCYERSSYGDGGEPGSSLARIAHVLLVRRGGM